MDSQCIFPQDLTAAAERSISYGIIILIYLFTFSYPIL